MANLESQADLVLGETQDVPATMSVDSNVLEPIVCTDTHIRFVLENKGILSRDSCIQIQLTTPDGDAGGFLPLSAGIFGLIRHATLRVGARNINDIPGLGYRKAMTTC